ncbi:MULTISPECIES: hypothetical protein [Rossellomorea]|uniref:Uncharacterized protein n=1 Tax=Rossellomorea vietnamensis TaxID=218284 RepID=A0A6I6UN10_9BACI|nr:MULTISPECIES: hypothetical protein [Rossellomorea]QHE63298.1 hypothetical protein FHE72_21645 [Rossellomorea vietnamensis]WGG45355.1 hypothetical protein P8596_22055 [Rossellomorea sp. DA94]
MKKKLAFVLMTGIILASTQFGGVTHAEDELPDILSISVDPILQLKLTLPLFQN